MPEGIVYDLQRQLIIGLQPRPEALPALEVALANEWQSGNDNTVDRLPEAIGYTDMLWLQPEYYDR